MTEIFNPARPVPSIYDLTPPELESFFLSIGEKQYRAKQVLNFLYSNPVSSFDEMTTLSKDLRAHLAGTLKIVTLTLRTTVESSDGSVKHGYQVESNPAAGCLLESVWMQSEPTDSDSSEVKTPGPETAHRYTICISSQLGCAAGCKFCATGRLGLRGQLSTGEIVYQVVDSLIRYKTMPDTILFMGMGEPMHNFNAVMSAVEILTHKDAMALSQRRIVMSTSGEIERLAAFRRRFPKVRLAISLNAAVDSLRSNLMPLNERYNLRAIAEFISRIELGKNERVTLEYVVLGGVNDTPVQIRALVGYLKPITDRVKVNLIPCNPVDGTGFRSPSRDRVLDIQEAIKELGIKAFIRHNRGRGVSAACGQLSGRT